MAIRALKASDDPAYAEGLRLADEGRRAEAVVALEKALRAHPDDSRILFALANLAADIGHATAAERFFRRVLEQEPDRVEPLVNLANLLRAGGRTSDVVGLLKPAIERNPHFAELWLTLGSALREAGDVATAETFYREALRLSPGFAPALGNLADLLADRGAMDEALAHYDSVIAADPQNPQARLNRAVLFLCCGDLAQGWQDYEYRLKLKKSPLRGHNLPRWNGVAQDGTLLVMAEQGIGDQIMFASLVPELAEKFAHAGGRLILEAEPRLVSLFARSFPGVSVMPSTMETHGTTHYAAYDWLAQMGNADYALALGSLPGLLRTRAADFPFPSSAYLVADRAISDNWRNWLSAQAGGPMVGGPTVGLCWRSGNVQGLRAAQYAPLEAWAAFARRTPGTLVSLQYDGQPEEIAALERASGRRILTPPELDQKQEIDRTAALIATLDAVVSAPTAVSWLAAGLNVPTLKILCNKSWTSFGTDHEPFAPAARAMAPERGGDWAEAFAKASEALAEIVKGRA